MDIESSATDASLRELYDFFSRIRFDSCRNCSDCCSQPWFLQEEKKSLKEKFQDELVEVDSVPMCDGETCRFGRNGFCAIYPERPLDCRLFPLDIVLNEDGYWWALFTTCRKPEELKRTLVPLIDTIEALMTPGMLRQYERQIAVTRKTYRPYREGRFELIRPYRPSFNS